MKFVRYVHRSDVIITGTPSALSAIHPRDVVEIEGIGVLRNPVVTDSTE